MKRHTKQINLLLKEHFEMQVGISIKWAGLIIMFVLTLITFLCDQGF